MLTISADAINALMSGCGVQKAVRDYIKGNDHLEHIEVATDIAKEVTTFRQEAEGYISLGDGEIEVKDRRKKANNICNDISRICRDSLGYSIVCKSRKNHSYEPKLAEEKPKKAPAPAPEPEAPIDPIDPLTALTKDQIELIARDWIRDHPREALGTASLTLSADEFGKCAVRILKRMKEQD